MIQDLFTQAPSLAERCKDFSAECRFDQAAFKAQMCFLNGIRDLIDAREMWREEIKSSNYDLT